jgi:hypothetical protein
MEKRILENEGDGMSTDLSENTRFGYSFGRR